jgi:predicted DNA-binding ribbon-helix-helix protein
MTKRHNGNGRQQFTDGVPSLTSMVKTRSMVVRGQRTIVSLEHGFWDVLEEIASLPQSSISELVGSIDAARPRKNLSSAIRLYVLEHHRPRSENID